MNKYCIYTLDIHIIHTIPGFGACRRVCTHTFRSLDWKLQQIITLCGQACCSAIDFKIFFVAPGLIVFLLFCSKTNIENPNFSS